MEYFLDGVLVVEGKEDKSFLSSFIKSPIVTINGKDTKNPMIVFLEIYGKTHNIYLLTDPDEAGRDIRESLNKRLIVHKNIEIDINNCVRGKKKGVAECTKEEILAKLEPFFVDRIPLIELNTNELYKMNLIGQDSSTNREKVCQKLGLPKLNSKNFVLALKLLEIDCEKLKELIN